MQNSIVFLLLSFFISGCSYTEKIIPTIDFRHKLTPLTIIDKSGREKEVDLNAPPKESDKKVKPSVINSITDKK